MKRNLARYDAAHSDLPTKDGFADVEEDAFQKRVDNSLKPVEVDPADKSMGAYFKRFR